MTANGAGPIYAILIDLGPVHVQLCVWWNWKPSIRYSQHWRFGLRIERHPDARKDGWTKPEKPWRWLQNP